MACASPYVTVADCAKNADEIIRLVHQAAKEYASLIVFPELSLTGYTCGDLFLQRSLVESAALELERVAKETSQTSIVAVVGLPVAKGDRLYNCAAFIHRGSIIALVPKTFIPNYAEFYEQRHFSSAPRHNVAAQPEDTTVRLSEAFRAVPFGTNILVQDETNRSATIAAEICEDVWVPMPPSTRHAAVGATIIANLSASNEVVGKAGYRQLLVSSQSARLMCAYLYADAGRGESTTDMVFAAHNVIAENGTILAESALFSNGLTLTEIDTELLSQERRRTGTFAQCADSMGNIPYRIVMVNTTCTSKSDLQNAKDEENLRYRRIEARPFVPVDATNRSKRCRDVVELQAEGLVQRLRHTGAKTAIIGLSGGLDSALALLVTVEAFRRCGLDSKGITAVTMPCFGTIARTRDNAIQMATLLETQFKEVPIQTAVRQHFSDIGHDEALHDVTYENSQARERTQILMDMANKNGGLVIGTGDLSELALGWATYNGDHMSMYGVNASIPKTLVKHLVRYYADMCCVEPGKEETDRRGAELKRALEDVLDTPVSPELLPPVDGVIAQKTEDLVGPYELHDFFLYYMLRCGFPPAKIFRIAKETFAGEYEEGTILKWLKTFYSRFFAQQFKRSCLPDGPKVGSVAVSPRGDLRMPSDACADIWLAEIEGL